MYNYTSCPVCKGANFNEFISCKDHTVSQETFNIVSCESCNFKFTNPIPDVSDLGKYYKSENYISHSNTKKGIVSRLYHLVRSHTLKKKLSLVSSNVSRGTLMDYGCGTGMFLDVCEEAGWRAFGMEPDAGARKIAKDMKLKVYENRAILDAAHKDERIDAITLWHVLEHIVDLDETLKFFKTKLSKDGVLIIAVPNYTSYDAKHYKEFWAAYDLPRHLYHFEIESLTRLLSNYGFNLETILPMKFDSFYVSMLSEKYKAGAINYLKAFITGLRSNLIAKRASDYSSVIYIFRHAKATQGPPLNTN